MRRRKGRDGELRGAVCCVLVYSLRPESMSKRSVRAGSITYAAFLAGVQGAEKRRAASELGALAERASDDARAVPAFVRITTITSLRSPLALRILNFRR